MMHDHRFQMVIELVWEKLIQEQLKCQQQIYYNAVGCFISLKSDHLKMII